MKKNIISIIIISVLLPITVIGGMKIFDEKKYVYLILLVSIISIIPFLVKLEKNKTDVQKLVIISVMTSITVASRALFEFVPHFKPVTALVIICGLYLGKEAGFICGAFSALISNFIFGQGPWTPFQMLSWGLCGFFASVFAKIIKKNVVALISFAVFFGVFYSLLMDVYTVLWMEETFNITRYFAIVITSLPTTITYCISNVIFLLLFIKPFSKKIERIKVKYGINL